MKKFHLTLLVAISLLVTNNCFAQQSSTHTVAQLRGMQTRVFKTKDFEAVINALNDATRALKYKGETKLIKPLSNQMTSYSCFPYSIVEKSSNIVGSAFLYCIMRRLDNDKGISVRLSVTGMATNIQTHQQITFGADPEPYQNIFNKMGDAMFINAQQIEPSELQ
jgi:hypothetical protein